MTNRLIFSINSGRSGSQYLAEVLNTGVGVVAFHEAAPPMIGKHLDAAMRAPLQESAPSRWIKVNAIRDTLAQHPPGTTYAESNHMFIKTFHDVVLHGFPAADIRVVVLRRYLPAVLQSFIRMGYFSAINDTWPKWMHIPSDDRVIRSNPETMDQYDLAISYLLDIELRAQKFAERHPGMCIPVRLEDLQKPARVEALFRDLTIQPTDQTWEIVGTKINRRAHKKNEFGVQTSLEYCQERLDDYIDMIGWERVDLPALDRRDN